MTINNTNTNVISKNHHLRPLLINFLNTNSMNTKPNDFSHRPINQDPMAKERDRKMRAEAEFNNNLWHNKYNLLFVVLLVIITTSAGMSLIQTAGTITDSDTTIDSDKTERIDRASKQMEILNQEIDDLLWDKKEIDNNLMSLKVRQDQICIINKLSEADCPK